MLLASAGLGELRAVTIFLLHKVWRLLLQESLSSLCISSPRLFSYMPRQIGRGLESLFACLDQLTNGWSAMLILMFWAGVDAQKATCRQAGGQRYQTLGLAGGSGLSRG
jgi:hypothetical protein